MNLKSGIKAVRESRPWQLAWAAGSAAVSLGLVWSNFWLGHVLFTHWPPAYWIFAWWNIPFVVTTFISFSIFANSISALATVLKRKFQ